MSLFRLAEAVTRERGKETRMADINEQDLLDEIQFDIKEKDLIKGRLVLSSLGTVSRPT